MQHAQPGVASQSDEQMHARDKLLASTKTILDCEILVKPDLTKPSMQQNARTISLKQAMQNYN